MERKGALVIAFLITGLIVGNYLFFTDAGVVRERVEISRVLDGDTVDLVDGRRIRLLNINTPEKGLAYSDLAKEFLSEFTNVELETAGLDRYERTLGKIYSGEKYLNLEIVRSGMAHTYLVADSENSLFARAERDARENEGGIWKMSSNALCISAEINKYDEYVEITDSCDVDFTGWILKDESTKSYKFSEDVGKSFILHSGKGSDTATDIYWGKEQHIWNDDHDEIFIRDADGFLAYYDSYG